MATRTITEQTQALVLVGNGNGLTIIPSPTSLTRLNYFDGKFLRAADLKLEQQYLRQLVALSNQAGCAGVVHGFSATLGGGDALDIGPGLAIDAGGKVLMMPRTATIAVTDLLETSSQSAAERPELSRKSLDSRVTQDALRAERATFADCALRAAESPGQVLEAANLYLIVVCHAEAFCGEEDVYGKLCEEACVTSTDRPYVVEGVSIRAVPLQLDNPLKTSSAVALNARHLRSRVASAYFADEWERIPHLISRAGLESEAWCSGADAESGACVPIGLLARSGSQTLFLDAWTARRERMETPPRKHWSGRMAMRPWSAFLAQVLQFQCQLHDCIGGLGDPGGQDPCAEAYELLRKSSQTLASVLEGRGDTPGAISPSDEAIGITTRPIQQATLATLERMQVELASAARQFFLAPRDRLLINCGIVETPAGGYLPVVPAGDLTVNQQVRRWFGEGVDLRFCVVRPDYVAHALEEVQHMERICLLKGLDDPDNLEEVDVLVPDGEIVPRGLEAGTAFRAVVRLGAGSRSQVVLQGTARGVRLDTDGLEFHTAGAAEAEDLPPFQPAPSTEVPGPLEDTGPSKGETTGFEGRPVAEVKPAFQATLSNLAVEARSFSAAERSQGVAVTRGWLPAGDVRVFTPQTPEPKVSAGWLTFRIEADPFDMEVGATVNASLRGIIFLPSRQLSEVQVPDARFTLGQLSSVGVGRTAVGRLVLTGITRTWSRSSGWQQEAFSETVIFQIDRERLPNGTEVLRAFFPLEDEAPRFELAAGGSPLTLRADLTRPPVGDEEGPQPVADGGFRESNDVLDPANALHRLASDALDLIEAGLQESGFADQGREALFPRPPASRELDILAKHDWVFFHRRRTKICALEDRPERPPPQPVQVTCQEVWGLESAAERFAQVLTILAIQDAVTTLREAGAVKLGEVEFVRGTDEVFMNSTRPIAAAWGERSLQRVAFIAEPRDPNDPAADPRIPLYRSQALTIARAIPSHVGGLQAQYVDPEVFRSDCPAITLLGNDPQAATVCNTVFGMPDPRAESFPAELAVLIKTGGLTEEIQTQLELALLGLVQFQEGTDQGSADDLHAVNQEWLDVRPDIPGTTILPAVVAVSRPGTAAVEHDMHIAQAAKVRDRLGGISDIIGVVAGGEGFPSDCPALTLVVPIGVAGGEREVGR